MRRVLFASLLFLTATSPLFSQALKTGNQYVTAIVEPLTGLISIRTGAGTNVDPVLSYPQKSFLYVMVGDRIFTNNNVGVNISSDPRYGGFLSDGMNQKIADTVRTTWSNKNGCDIIQEVYPVRLDASGQIVIRWEVKNNSNTPVWGQAQFLLDIAIGSQNPNDGAPVLTRYGYRPIWEQYTAAGNYGIPWLFACFEKTLPNPPSFAPGVSGVGYTDDVNYKLGLKRPARMTIGDWGAPLSNALVDNLWGVPSAAPWGTEYTDAAMLLEWDGAGVLTGTTTEIARTSYGTGEFGICTGQLFGIVFYPRHFHWNIDKYRPDTGAIDFYAFDVYSPLPQDPNYGPPSTNTFLKLHVGPDLRITEPDTANVGQREQRQLMGPAAGYIPQYGVGTAFWQIVADKPDSCKGTIGSWLKFNAESSLSGTGPIFYDSGPLDTCEHPIVIDCTIQDVDTKPPFVSKNLEHDLDTVFKFYVTDNDTFDSGIKDITVKFGPGVDTSKFIVSVYPPLVPCSKDTHTVSIIGIRPLSGFSFEYIVTDCANNVTNSGTIFADFFDQIPPEIISRVDSPLVKTQTMTVKDGLSGIQSIDFQNLDSTRFNVSISPPLTPCFPFEHTITVHDNGGKDRACVYVKITDCQVNTTNDSMCFPGTVSVEVSGTKETCELIGNPASGRTTLFINSLKSQPATIRVVDISGREVASHRVSLIVGANDIPIATASFAEGTYYIIAEWSGRQYAKKLQVLK